MQLYSYMQFTPVKAKFPAEFTLVFRVLDINVKYNQNVTIICQTASSFSRPLVYTFQSLLKASLKPLA